MISRVFAKVRVLVTGRASRNLHALNLLLVSSILDVEFATEVIKTAVCLALRVVVDKPTAQAKSTTITTNTVVLLLLVSV